MEWLRNLLALPELAGLDIDDSATTKCRVDIIRRKSFLNRLYREWYGLFKAAADTDAGLQVELGSGAGFLDEIMPGVVTSDIQAGAPVDVLLEASRMPFPSDSVSAFFLLNVFHHMDRPAAFLEEAQRCLTDGGRVVMIEPYNSHFGRAIYRHFHHEPFEPKGTWESGARGPLSGANGALPWIVFQRDRDRFEREFPALRIERMTPFIPFSYLLSGGVSMRSFLPGIAYSPVRTFEKMLSPLKRWLAMFVLIELAYDPSQRCGGSDASP